ncbi:MAG TPA: Tm-1-like ATP-binding domain-containing protein [Anaerolineae bacterium]|nr:Tm-1-like ATP-binding domain-containing protein [Anaerolineae bacterium]
MAKNIVIVATLDTKGAEASYLRELIEKRGHRAILVDTNMGGEPAIKPDISADVVAKAGGGNIQEIRASKDRGRLTPIMVKGAIVKIKELHAAGRVDGILSFGGASNTTIGTSIMKAFPFGLPKFMLSSTASMPAYAAQYIGTSDIAMMHSVVDIAGLNDLVRDALNRAAGAICGMVESGPPISADALKGREKPLIAVTEFGFAEGAGRYSMQYLEEKGYEPIAIHSQGIGDRAMEELISQGIFDGVLDLVPAGVSEEWIGGNRAAGPTRLEAAGARGIPHVLTPCGFDMISCGPLSRKDRGDPLWESRRLAERKMFLPDEFRLQIRTNAEELRETAKIVAQKLNKSKGPVKFLIPTQGWSKLSVEGADLHEPDTDKVFVQELRRNLKPEIEIIELDTHLNTPEFAKAAVDALDAMMRAR